MKRNRRGGRASLRRGHFETYEGRLLLASDLVISEFMADNDGYLADEDGEYSDWIEIFNRGSDDESLQGWYLTDDPDELDKWSFPNESLSGGSFLLVPHFGQGPRRRRTAAAYQLWSECGWRLPGVDAARP